MNFNNVTSLAINGQALTQLKLNDTILWRKSTDTPDVPDTPDTPTNTTAWFNQTELRNMAVGEEKTVIFCNYNATSDYYANKYPDTYMISGGCILNYKFCKWAGDRLADYNLYSQGYNILSSLPRMKQSYIIQGNQKYKPGIAYASKFIITKKEDNKFTIKLQNAYYGNPDYYWINSIPYFYVGVQTMQAPLLGVRLYDEEVGDTTLWAFDKWNGGYKYNGDNDVFKLWCNGCYLSLTTHNVIDNSSYNSANVMKAQMIQDDDGYKWHNMFAILDYNKYKNSLK